MYTDRTNRVSLHVVKSVLECGENLRSASGGASLSEVDLPHGMGMGPYIAQWTFIRTPIPRYGEARDGKGRSEALRVLTLSWTEPKDVGDQLMFLRPSHTLPGIQCQRRVRRS